MTTSITTWILFNLFVVFMLALDLFIFHRKSHKIEIKEALISSAIWIGIALIFNLGLYYFQGKDPALKFFTGYLIEKSLSVDNLFVFLMIFQYFNTPPQYIHKILFWGILGAIVMRALFIFLGIALVSTFHWILYIFGAFLVFTGIKMALHRAEEVKPEDNILLKLFRKMMPITPAYHGDRFFIKEQGLWMATPLFVTLLAVESTDILFAVDSIPAIMAITLDPFIIYSSNIFAILGLRALFFALAGMMDLFHFLHYGLALILAFVGVKMLISEFVKIPIGLALGFIAAVLLLSIIISIIYPKPQAPTSPNSGNNI